MSFFVCKGLGTGGLDVWVASLLLLCSAAFTFYAYDHVFALRNHPTLQLGVIQPGESGFKVVQGGKCVGTLQVLNEQTELLRLRVDGRIRVSWMGEENALRIMVEGFFNPLDQLIKSRMDITLGTSHVFVSSTDVHPVQLSFSVHDKGSQIERTMQIPGPIVIHKLEKSALSLEYPALPLMAEQHIGAGMDALSSDLHFTLEPLESANGPAISCSPEESGIVDLSSVFARAMQLGSKFAPLLSYQLAPGA